MPGAVDNRILAPQPEIVPYDVAYHNALDALRELAHAVGERHRVHLVAENCPGKFLISPLEFPQFLDEIHSPWVGACFDTGNALWYGYPEHWIAILGPRIKRVHLKDNRIVAPGAVVATPLLAGDVDWPAVRETLAATHYDGWLIAEVYPHYNFHPERLICAPAPASTPFLSRSLHRSGTWINSVRSLPGTKRSGSGPRSIGRSSYQAALGTKPVTDPGRPRLRAGRGWLPVA